ncbi:MAG: hypothetical protein ACREUQ_10590 [Burkholderiales bacterium]
MQEVKETKVPQLDPGMDGLALFEHVSTRYDAKINHGVTLEQILVPAFWAHHAVRLKPMDEIRARAEDGTWIAELTVLDCSRTWASVCLRSVHHFTTSDVSISKASESEVKTFIEAHRVVWRGPRKFSVIRNEDNAVLTEGIEQKENAKIWLEKHARKQIGSPRASPVTA